MAFWLIKSEPVKFSWDDMRKAKKTHWDGVRNHQAANNLKAMKKGDTCFFYHSNEGKEIVGTCTVAREAYPDPSDATGKFVMVDVAVGDTFETPLTLEYIKHHATLKDMSFVKQSRLSVSPVTAAEAKLICKLGGV